MNRLTRCFWAALALSSMANAWCEEVTIRVDASQAGRPVSRHLTGVCIEDVNHEIYGGIYSQMIFGESFQEPPRTAALKGSVSPDATAATSGMWGPISSGNAPLSGMIEKNRSFIGVQSQRITCTGSEGEVGIENQGLNRQGMAFTEGKPYEGYVWLRSEKPADVLLTLESRDGARRYAETTVASTVDEWRRFNFTLTPNASDRAGRFAIRLPSPGSVVIGHAFLQPGDWGRFKGLPLRRDAVDGLIDQGVTVLRYGGSMVNEPEYRWKKVIGPRDHRPPYRGHWYPHSSNGWGMIDFLDLCDAAGFMAIPDFNIDETPRDMADFIDYANGPVDGEWGKRRAADGHPTPYNVRHIELGNEEKIDDAYFKKFASLAKVIWQKDPAIILVVGDFQYKQIIDDPLHFEGADSKITSLAAHKRILDLARQNGREVWFDTHMWTAGPAPSPSALAFRSYVDAIEKLAEGAKHHVVVFEFNANNHDQRRALANAAAIGAIMRDGRVPVALSANALQPDGQNDNGWDQGLLFLNPSRVWLQPPGFVARMISRSYQPRVLESHVEGAALSVTATRSDDGKHLVLQVVNLGQMPQPSRIQLIGFTPSNPIAELEILAGPLDAKNSDSKIDGIKPTHIEWRHNMKDGVAGYTFLPYSFTVIQLN